MAEYSRDDARYARQVVERCLDREAEDLQIEQDLVVVDIESDANAFSDDLAVLERFDAKMPAVQIGNEAVPVALEFAMGWPERELLFPRSRLGVRPLWRGHPFFEEFIYEGLRGYLKGDLQIYGLTSMDRQEARQTFLRRATDFLATRVGAIRRFRNREPHQTWYQPSFLNLRQRLRGPVVTTPGCNFTVATNSRGLRVFWSGAYRVSSNYFNHPTTPTASVLQSGTYIFGVDGGAYANNIQWDFNAVVSLPGQPYVHLNF